MDKERAALLDAAAAFLWSDTLQDASESFVRANSSLFAGAVCFAADAGATLCASLATSRVRCHTARAPCRIITGVRVLIDLQVGLVHEQRLEWQPVYQQYRDLYERALEGFCARQGVDLETFVAACQDALDNSEWAHHRGFAECVLAMATYEYFIKMMASAADSGCAPATAADASSAGHGEGLVDDVDGFL